MVEAVRPGGRVAVSAFSSYFAVRHLESTDAFDAAAGVNHERTEIRNEAGERREVDLWTSCFTPRELRLMAERSRPDGRAPVVGHPWRVCRRIRPTWTTPSGFSSGPGPSLVVRSSGPYPFV